MTRTKSKIRSYFQAQHVGEVNMLGTLESLIFFDGRWRWAYLRSPANLAYQLSSYIAIVIDVKMYHIHLTQKSSLHHILPSQKVGSLYHSDSPC